VERIEKRSKRQNKNLQISVETLKISVDRKTFDMSVRSNKSKDRNIDNTFFPFYRVMISKIPMTPFVPRHN